MGLKERLGQAYGDIKEVVWVIFVPLFLDLMSLFTYSYLLKGKYVGVNKLFVIKLGVISAPPSVGYIVENFPTGLFSYNTNYGISGLVMDLSLFNVLLILSVSLVHSFMKSGYMGCLEAAGRTSVRPSEFIFLANKNWFKYFVLHLIFTLTGLMVITNSSYIFLSLIISALLFYTQYSIVIDEGSTLKNIGSGMSILGKYMVETIKMGLYYGFLMSILSPLIFPLTRMGSLGLIIAMIAVNYFGMSVNKAVLELYRDMRNGGVA